VSKRTNVVVLGRETGQKLDAARRIGIETIDEQRFRRLVGVAAG
jgi:NAD-dependent DNA ligase